jgi:hypothetical protein
MLSRLNKSEILFFVTSGEPGDNTCMKYVINNGYKYEDWIPVKRGHNRADEKLEFIKKSDHTILVTNGESRGIMIAMRFAGKNISGKIVIVDYSKKMFSVWKDGKKIGEKKIDG